MKPAQLGQLVFIAVAAFFVYAFVGTAKEGELRRACASLCALAPHYADTNRRAPDFELPNLAGKKVRLSEFRGRTVILNFWSKSCPPCLEEMPSLAALAHSIEGRKDVVLLTVTTDESAEDAKRTLDSVLGAPAPFEVLVDSDARIVTERFGTRLFPETWFIDPNGLVVARVDGARDWNDPATMNFVTGLANPLGCPVTFHGGRPEGPGAEICGIPSDR